MSNRSTQVDAIDYPMLMGEHWAFRSGTDGVEVQAFLDRLAARLLDFDTAGAEEFVRPSDASAMTRSGTATGTGSAAVVERAAGAAEASCSDFVGNLLTVSGAVGFGVQGAFPIAGTVMSAAVGLFASACDDTSSRLDAIDSRLDALQASLDNLADSLGELRVFTAQAAINEGEDAFQSLTRNAERIAGTARALKLNYGVASLREYVQQQGGDSPTPLRRALEKENFSGPLAQLLQAFRPAGVTASGAILPLGGGMLQQFERLLQDGALATIVAAVKLQCDNPPSGDVVKLRVNCNLFVGTSVARLAAAQRVSSELAAEVYELFDAYKATDRDVVAQNNYLLGRTAAEYRAALKAAFVAQQDTLVARYRAGIDGNPDPEQKGMYNVFRGLDAGVLAAVGNASCYDDGLRMVAITGWTRTGSTETLETHCRNVGVPVPARYDLMIDRVAVNSRSDICNVLGVLIPCVRLAVIDPRYASSTEYLTFSSAEPVALKLTDGRPRAGHFATNANWLADRVGQTITARPLPTTGFGLTQLQNPRGFDDRGIADISLTRPVQYIRTQVQLVYVTWLRHTGADGFSVVFAFWSLGATRLACASADCRVGEGLLQGQASANRGLYFLRGLQGLTLGDYGWTVTADDFQGTRTQFGFYAKQGERYLPIYPR